MDGNLFRNIPNHFPDELFETLLEAGRLRVERIVSRGHATPAGQWYDQQTGEWVLLLRGGARLRIEGEADARHLEPGDYVHLPAGVRHRVEWTPPDQDTVWLAVHYEPCG